MFRHFLPASLLLLTAAKVAAGSFTSSTLTGDADSGISGNNAYTLAIDMGDGANRTIGGAVFTGSGNGQNPGTNNYSTTGITNNYLNWPANNPPGALVTGATGGLFANFDYQGAGGTETLTLKNLRIGQTYTTTFYNAVWGGPRGQNITTSDGGAITFDADAVSPGSLLKYTFTASSNAITYTMAPNNAASFHQYGFSNQVVGQKALFTDNFYAPSNPNTNDLNFNLAARQGGSLVTSGGTMSWVAVNNTQVGNSTGGIDSGNYLLNAFGNGISALDHNFNGTGSAGGLSVSFDLAPDSTGHGATDWEGINIGQDNINKNGAVNGGHSHLAFIFRDNGHFNTFDGSTELNDDANGPLWSATSHTNDLTHMELLLTDPTDQNPFDGVGQTDIALYVNGVLTYNFSKTGGGYADNYINFSSAWIGGVDNLAIASLVPEPTGLVMTSLAAFGLLAKRRRR